MRCKVCLYASNPLPQKCGRWSVKYLVHPVGCISSVRKGANNQIRSRNTHKRGTSRKKSERMTGTGQIRSQSRLPSADSLLREVGSKGVGEIDTGVGDTKWKITGEKPISNIIIFIFSFLSSRTSFLCYFTLNLSYSKESSFVVL